MKTTISTLVILFALSSTAAHADLETLDAVPSPHVVEIEMSPVVATIMPGGWWHDRSAGHQHVEDVILRSVSATRAKKRKTVVLTVRAEIGSRVIIQNVDEVKIELLSPEGEPIVSTRRQDFKVGRDSAGLSGTKYVELEHKFSKAEFEALFADEKPLRVRVTITEEE